jgi:uncharacterized membrane protein YebE (DUF533 family)
VNDQNGRYARVRYTATGALAALAAVGVIAGTGALAANPGAKAHRHAAVANRSTTKAPTSPVPDKTDAPQPAVNHQPFVNAIQQLVDDGTITATEGQAVDREIQAGGIDTDTLTGFTQAQLQALEQTLSNAKRALAPGVTGGPRSPKEPPPAGTGAPNGGKEPPPAAQGNNSTPK